MLTIKTNITVSGQGLNLCEECSHKDVCKNLDILRAAVSSIESASIYEPTNNNGTKETHVKDIPWLSINVTCRNWSRAQRTQQRRFDIYDT